jgi:hypothetical protein
MRQSLQNEDWELLKSSVHKMIPSFSIIGLRNEDMAGKIKTHAIAHENIAEINTMVTQLETHVI